MGKHKELYGDEKMKTGARDSQQGGERKSIMRQAILFSVSGFSGYYDVALGICC